MLHNSAIVIQSQNLTAIPNEQQITTSVQEVASSTSEIAANVQETVVKRDSQELFSGVDISCAIEQSADNLNEKISPPMTLIPFTKPSSPPPSPVKSTQRDSVRREKMEMSLRQILLG